MTDSAPNNPVLTFEGKRYDLNTLPDELKELVRGMQVADAQLRMHEDTLKVLAVGRQSLASQLNERLKSCYADARRIKLQSFSFPQKRGPFEPPFFVENAISQFQMAGN
jgi:hypothetical protein